MGSKKLRGAPTTRKKGNPKNNVLPQICAAVLKGTVLSLVPVSPHIGLAVPHNPQDETVCSRYLPFSLVEFRFRFRVVGAPLRFGTRSYAF